MCLPTCSLGDVPSFRKSYIKTALKSRTGQSCKGSLPDAAAAAAAEPAEAAADAEPPDDAAAAAAPPAAAAAEAQAPAPPTHRKMTSPFEKD